MTFSVTASQAASWFLGETHRAFRGERPASADSNPIEIEDLPKERDENILLHAMGSEAANVHLESRAQADKILKDLRRRNSYWLRKAAKDMAETVECQWKEYRKS